MDASCNAPVVGADVRVYDNTPGSRAQGVGIRKLVADNTGAYRTILAAGQYSVTVTAPGYFGATQQFAFEGSDPQLTFYLKPQIVYGVPYDEWRAKHQKEASPDQKAAFEKASPKH